VRTVHAVWCPASAHARVITGCRTAWRSVRSRWSVSATPILARRWRARNYGNATALNYSNESDVAPYFKNCWPS